MDFFHSWAVAGPQFSGKLSLLEKRNLAVQKINLIASRHIRGGKASFRLTYDVPNCLCISTLFNAILKQLRLTFRLWQLSPVAYFWNKRYCTGGTRCVCGEDEEGLAMGTANRFFKMVNTGCFCITEKTFSHNCNTWQIARKSYHYSPFL